MDPKRPFVGKLKLMFQDMAVDTWPLLSEDQVSRIPPKILEMLFREYAPQNFGDMGTVVRMTDQRHYETITKIVQWITEGEAASFLVQHKPRVRKRNGDRTTFQFQPQVHADDDTYSVTQATHTCFAEEIDLYLFSIRFQLANLQIYMSRKLRSYPVYASEIGMLISKLYCTGNQSSKHVDPALANFIANRINCCRGTLIADGNLLSSLRTCIPPKVELESLYRHTNMNTTTIENALQAFRHAVAATDTTAALLQTFERQHLNASSDPRLAAPPTVPIYERPTTGHSSGGAFDQTQEAVQILNAILRDKRVVRASQNCSGTLLSGPAASELRPNSRNEFRVDIGQYLVRLTNYRPRYSRTLVFCNASGEIGELPDTSMLAPIQDTNVPLPLPQTQRIDGNKRPRNDL